MRLHDLHYEEVRIAALLHDIAEILMWCFAPGRMLEVMELRKKDSALRSHAAQEQILGFGLVGLQNALAAQWGLPRLLINLMSDAGAMQPRVRNVVLAVNLARHSAAGWEDAALPDDFAEIGELLRISPRQVKSMYVPETQGDQL